MSFRPAGEILILIDFVDQPQQRQREIHVGAGDIAELQIICLAQTQAQSPVQETDKVGKMEAKLRALPVLSEDPGLAPRIMWCTITTTQGIRYPAASEGTGMHMAYTKSQGHRYIQINKKSS